MSLNSELSSRAPNSRRVAVFPGSFDPLTHGHVDIISRSLKIFDRVIVAVLNNTEKETLFSAEERVELVREQFAAEKDCVAVDSFQGLLVDYVKKSQAGVIIRGLRAISDYDYEVQMALMNKSLDDNIETLFLVTKESYSYISSTFAKQIAQLGGDVSKLVPSIIEQALARKLGRE